MSLRGCIGTPIVALQLLLVPGRPAELSAQLATAAGAPPAAELAAGSYDALFDELLRMSPVRTAWRRCRTSRSSATWRGSPSRAGRSTC